MAYAFGGTNPKMAANPAVLAPEPRRLPSTGANAVSGTHSATNGWDRVARDPPFRRIGAVGCAAAVQLVLRRSWRQRRSAAASAALEMSSRSEPPSCTNRCLGSAAQDVDGIHCSIDGRRWRRVSLTARKLVRWASGTSSDEKVPMFSAIFLSIVKFVVPAFALVATNMVLTAVDKAFIGQVSVLQLAALGPASAMFDCCSYLFTFINTAILSLLKRASSKEDAMKIRSHSLAFSVGGGIVLCLGLLATAEKSVRFLGSKGSLIPYSIVYLQIRALGAPVDRLGSAATQFWLAEKDGVTPMVGTLLAAVLNVIGDFLLCPKYGIVGAGIATVLASATSAAFLIWRLIARGLWPRPLKLPSMKDFKPFAAFAGPVSVILLMKIFSFAMMTAGAAHLGTTELASHQILVSALLVGGISLGQPLCWAAQSFIPGAVGVEKHRTENALFLATFVNAILGGLVAAFVSCGPGVKWFTSDVLVRLNAMAASTPAVLFSMMYIVYLTMEGVAIARQRLALCLVISASVFVGGGAAMYLLDMFGLLTLHSLWAAQAILVGAASAILVGTRNVENAEKP